MNPGQLKETTISPDTRRLVQLSYGTPDENLFEIMDMLLGKKNAQDRKKWIQSKGNIRELE